MTTTAGLEAQLQEKLTELGTELEVPGVAVGILVDGQEHYAFHGVTNIEHPLPVDASTLFQFGSTGKTFTATALMILIEQGHLDLDTRVADVIEGFRMKDASVADRVTILQLLNHTAGWSGDLLKSTGDGDDALEKYLELAAEVDQVTPLGETVSYNNTSLSIAGRVIELVTGLTFEQAIKELLLEPLGLDDTWFFATDIMTRRFASGHEQHPDGTIHVARPWALARSAHPAGGISGNAADQIAWARFHLGDGTAADGKRVLSEAALKSMQQPTVLMPGSALGDAVGISWLLREVGGVTTVGHGGTTHGQHSSFTMVPERRFAFVSMTNCGPNGPQLNKELERWALEAYLGVVEPEPEPLQLGDDELAPFVGHYETIAALVDIVPKDGRLEVQVAMKPEMAAELNEEGAEVPEQPPFLVGLLAGDGDRYVVAEGPAKGMRGYFVRDGDGNVRGIHMGGRLATKT
jgi:CubicO group peptidase (beta-lactamase class C family)